MAKNTFETPEVRTFPVIPKLEDSATAHLAPFKSKEEKALEKNKGENVDTTELSEQFKRMCEDVNKHTIELAKCTEQVFRFNRELTETKDLLKSFMVKYDMFAEETTQNFTDYENALSDLEKRLENSNDTEGLVENNESNESETDTNEAKSENDDAEPKTTEEHQLDPEELKNMVKQELYSS